MSAALGAEERHLARGTLLTLGSLGVVVGIVAGLLIGPQGAASALVGVGFVALLFGVSSLALAWSAARGGESALALLAGGALARLVLYAVALAGLGQLEWVHRPSLALATGGAVAITLAYELRALARRPHLFFIDAQHGRPRVEPPATGSQTL